MNTRYRNQNSF